MRAVPIRVPARRRRFERRPVLVANIAVADLRRIHDERQPRTAVALSETLPNSLPQSGVQQSELGPGEAVLQGKDRRHRVQPCPRIGQQAEVGVQLGVQVLKKLDGPHRHHVMHACSPPHQHTTVHRWHLESVPRGRQFQERRSRSANVTASTVASDARPSCLRQPSRFAGVVPVAVSDRRGTCHDALLRSRAGPIVQTRGRRWSVAAHSNTQQVGDPRTILLHQQWDLESLIEVSNGFCLLAADEGTDLAAGRGRWFPFGCRPRPLVRLPGRPTHRRRRRRRVRRPLLRAAPQAGGHRGGGADPGGGPASPSRSPADICVLAGRTHRPWRPGGPRRGAEPGVRPDHDHLAGGELAATGRRNGAPALSMDRGASAQSRCQADAVGEGW